MTSKDVQGATQMGFGKVLTSIQGLQQRLADFSVEDVARTEGNAQTLALKLAQLQTKLAGLDALQGFVASANAQLAAVPEENLEQAEPAALEKYPDLAAILQAEALIRRHGLTRPEKPAPGARDSKAETSSATAAGEEFPDHDFVAEIEVQDSAARPNREAIEAEDWVLSADPEKNLALAAHARDFELGNLPDDAATAAPASETSAGQKPQAAAPGQGSAAFDERLLNELIESYGEFTISAGATPKTEPAVEAPSSSSAEPEMAQAKPVESQALPEAAPIEAAPSPQRAAIETPALVTAIAPRFPAPVETLPAVLSEPEEAQSKALIVPETAKSKKDQREARVREKKLQAATKRGEIDRQLKSIIKDYGEYDLYSPRSTINFKLAAIGAFAVLGLVLGGLYFFKAPATLKPAAVTTIESHDGTQSPASADKPARK